MDSYDKLACNFKNPSECEEELDEAGESLEDEEMKKFGE